MKSQISNLKSPKRAAIFDLVRVMARLRAPDGCPWDREQDHRTLRFHAVEEVYELIDAIEAGDDHEMLEELGDLLLQVVFHAQLAAERGAFDFEAVARRITDKLISRHPHVFGETQVKTVEGVWAQWDQLKHAEKAGTRHARLSALDGIPKHLPALLRVEKLVKKARKAKLLRDDAGSRPQRTQRRLAEELFALAAYAQGKGWSAEQLVRAESQRQERILRQREQRQRRSQTRPGTRPGQPVGKPAERSNPVTPVIALGQLKG